MDNLYLFDGRTRWVGDIKNHVLRIRNSNTERNISQYYSLPLLSPKNSFVIEESQNDYAIENAKREVQVRIKQSIFRKKVLENFNYECCLTGIAENEFLLASHIIPWAAKIDTRLSPHNGLCLSVLYDSLFDKGFFTINDQYEVLVTSKIADLSSQTQKWLHEISGQTISPPKKYKIDKSALEYHRNNIFDKF